MFRFEPRYRITATTAHALMRIEAAREAVSLLPIDAQLLGQLRETARLASTHYSTAIEGNRLTAEQVSRVLSERRKLASRRRDEREVLGYHAALANVERLGLRRKPLTVAALKTLHALAMGGGRLKVKPTPFRDGQNVIRDGRSGRIIYLPPESREVPSLIESLVTWLNATADSLPAPIRAALAHYQFATIHPYYDGNGRTARLLATLVLHLAGYDLKGIYSLEEYYARDLAGYYGALTVGPTHNYYDGRAEQDLTPWVEYFCQGMADSFERVRLHAQNAAARGAADQSTLLRQLDARQRLALSLFRSHQTINSRDLKTLLGLSQRTARNILGRWAVDGFVTVHDASRKKRRYALASAFIPLLQQAGRA